MSSTQTKAMQLLSMADVQINGSRPWDIQVHDDRLYQRVLSEGSMGLGESYMDGWWDCDQIDELVFRLVHSGVRDQIQPWKFIGTAVKARVMNLQSRSKAFEIGERHYNTGNDLFELMLDSRMAYSCGYWKNAENLEKAQEAKLDLVCHKLQLKEGMHVLDIGGGWGSFAKFAAERYGVRVTAITVATEQAELGRKRVEGLPVEIIVQDYREVQGEFDRVLSIGMFEHVGEKNYREYMEVVHRVLKDDGLQLVHTIGGNRSVHKGDPWMEKYIFPNGMVPSVAQIGKSIEKLFVMEDWHNFGTYYDPTLMAWFENFDREWPSIREKYGDRFYRMWKFYLLTCAGLFRSRHLQLWQVVMSKHGVLGGYESIR
jgi:cyclopropane-fatty-acyl-phospholipid synthase